MFVINLQPTAASIGLRIKIFSFVSSRTRDTQAQAGYMYS